MSFFSPPVGLVRRNAYARYRQVYANDMWALGEVAECHPEEPFADYVIFTFLTTEVTMSADPADMEFLSVTRGFTDLSFAPFYTLGVTVHGPNGLGHWNDPPACRTEPPFTYDNLGPFALAEFDGTLVDAGGTAVSSTVSEVGVDANNLAIRGYLVNPAPVWPSPDIEGNTFGRVLWTAEQIPAVSASVYVQRGPQQGINPARIFVNLTPYDEGDPEPEGLPHQCVMGQV